MLGGLTILHELGHAKDEDHGEEGHEDHGTLQERHWSD